MRASHARLRAGHARLRAGHARLRASHARLRAGHARLRASQAPTSRTAGRLRNEIALQLATAEIAQASRLVGGLHLALGRRPHPEVGREIDTTDLTIAKASCRSTTSEMKLRSILIFVNGKLRR